MNNSDANRFDITGGNSKLFSVLNCRSWAIYLKNLVSVFVLFHIIFSANDALGVEDSFAL
jgi:hypothetical protein